MRPHNLPATLLGAGLLWFGWYGFNAGSALAAGAVAANAFLATTVAPAAAVLAWLIVEHRLDGRPTSLGAASAVVAGWSASPRPAATWTRSARSSSDYPAA